VLCFSSLCKCVYVFSVNTKVYSHPSLHHTPALGFSDRRVNLRSVMHYYMRM
jgi:hypothetical protein